MKPEVEWFSEDVDGTEYLNVGLKFYRGEEVSRCVMGAFGEEIGQEAMQVISALVEQAVEYVQEVYDADATPKLEIVTPKLVRV